MVVVWAGKASGVPMTSKLHSASSLEPASMVLPDILVFYVLWLASASMFKDGTDAELFVNCSVWKGKESEPRGAVFGTRKL